MGVRGQAKHGGRVDLGRRLECEEAETPGVYGEDSWEFRERKK